MCVAQPERISTFTAMLWNATVHYSPWEWYTSILLTDKEEHILIFLIGLQFWDWVNLMHALVLD